MRAASPPHKVLNLAAFPVLVVLNKPVADRCTRRRCRDTLSPRGLGAARCLSRPPCGLSLPRIVLTLTLARLVLVVVFGLVRIPWVLGVCRPYLVVHLL